MVRFVFVAVLALIVASGCRPACRGADFDAFGPAVAFAAFPDKSCPCDTCPCATSGVCTCPEGKCNCPACPGGGTARSLPPGVAATYAGAVKSAAWYRVPLVAFVGTPARPVAGCVSYQLDGDGNPRIWTGRTAGDGVTLDPLATDAEILAAVKAPTYTLTASRADVHSHTCPRCRTTWQHTDAEHGNPGAHSCPRCGTLTWQQSGRGATVNALAAPPMPAWTMRTAGCPGGT